MGGLSLGLQLSESKIAEGVLAGRLAPRFGSGLHPAVLLPLLRYGLGSVWSPTQSGPLSLARDGRTAGIDAVQHLGMLVGQRAGLVDVTRQGAERSSAAAAYPPASGKKAIFMCLYLWLPMKSVSLPTQIPVGRGVAPRRPRRRAGYVRGSTPAAAR